MEQVLSALKDVAVFLVTGGLGYIAFEIHKARESVVELNTKIAVILEKLANHEHEIERHERRLSHLETKKRGKNVD
jgi:hypothetical protein